MHARSNAAGPCCCTTIGALSDLQTRRPKLEMAGKEQVRVRECAMSRYTPHNSANSDKKAMTAPPAPAPARASPPSGPDSPGPSGHTPNSVAITSPTTPGTPAHYTSGGTTHHLGHISAGQPPQTSPYYSPSLSTTPSWNANGENAAATTSVLGPHGALRMRLGSSGGGGSTLEDEEADLLGDALVRILNDRTSPGGRAFWYDNTTPEATATAQVLTEEFRPLLSSYGISLFRLVVKQFGAFLASLIFGERSTCSDFDATVSSGRRNIPRRPDVRETLQSAAVLLVLSTIVLTGPVSVVVFFSFRAIALTLVFLSTILFDYEEIKTLAKEVLPGWLVSVVGAACDLGSSFTQWTFRQLNDYVFLGREYAGRGGEGTPSTEYRSQGTRDHLNALSFCSNMVSRAEAVRLEERKQKIEERRLRKKSKSPRKNRRRDDSKAGGSDASSSGDGGSFRPHQPLRMRDRVRDLERNMPNGDELLHHYFEEGGDEAYSDCFDSPDGLREPYNSGESTSGKKRAKYQLEADLNLDELLSSDDDRRSYASSSVDADGSTSEESYNMRLESLSDAGSDHSSNVSSSVPSAVANFSVGSRSISDKERELNWLDVGTKVGIRLLNSEKVQKIIKDPKEAEKLLGQNKAGPDQAGLLSVPSIISATGDSSVVPVAPKHALWTSPTAAAMRRSLASIGSDIDMDSDSVCGASSSSVENMRSDCLETPRKVTVEAVLSATYDENSKAINESSESLWSQEKPLGISSFTFRKVEENSKRKMQVEQLAQQSNRADRLPPNRRSPVLPGVKMVVPIIPIQPHGHGAGTNSKQHRHKAKVSGPCHFHMATVTSSERIYVGAGDSSDVRKMRLSQSVDEDIQQVEVEIEQEEDETNCLSITAMLDNSFLRNGKFATITIRVMDEWRGEKYMPRHSKLPIGSCVATTFGIGVLVGWRVEDDVHVVQSLWQKRGAGSAVAYLNRDALKGVVPGSVGFDVVTSKGKGRVVAYTHSRHDFLNGTFAVKMKPRGRHSTQVLKLDHSDIEACKAAKFMPVIELIKVAAQYQIQLEMYELALRQRRLLENETWPDDKEAFWSGFEEAIEMLMSSILKAISEDDEFDEGMNEFLSSVIEFLEQLDFGAGKGGKQKERDGREIDLDDKSSTIFASTDDDATTAVPELSSAVSDESFEEGESIQASATFWDDMFGGIFRQKKDEEDRSTVISTATSMLSSTEQSEVVAIEKRTSKGYRKIYAFLKTAMRSVAIARASVPDQNLQMGLSIVYEFFLFVRTIIKVQQSNSSPESILAWKTVLKEFGSIFGPMKQRMAQLGKKVKKRLERHGKKAKIRLLRFLDIVLADEQFLQSLELLEWSQCIYRVEDAVVRAKVIDEETCEQYHKAGVFLFDTLAPRASQGDAAARNEEKLAQFARFLKVMASPHRSLLKILTRDDTLELVERVLVRVFQVDSEAALMLSIYASNAKSIRNLRMLKDMPVCGRLWGPLLDAAVEEFSAIVEALPDNGKVFIEPIARLFSFGVANFHKIRAGDIDAVSAHWLDFLTKEEAVESIQEIDLKLRTQLDSFLSDVKEVMEVLPYYSTIDEDILQLIDELSIKKFLKEAADALLDSNRFPIWLKEKMTIAIGKFLDYLPKMSIPIERREIGEGWVVTCRGKDGEDLRLSDVQVEQDNLTCEVLGGGNILSPMFELKKAQNAANVDNDAASSVGAGATVATATTVEAVAKEDELDDEERISILNDVADLIRNAQLHGCWESGRGGVKDCNACIDPVLKGLPVSEVLKCGIELWQNLEIDDDELMELAIRDVSYQIQLQKDTEDGKIKETRDESNFSSPSFEENFDVPPSSSFDSNLRDGDSTSNRWRFNPRNDPTILYLNMINMTFALDEFLFRVEPAERSNIFDPVFEGSGSLKIKNVSIKLRLQIYKERIQQLDTEVFVPILFVETLDVALEKVKFQFIDSGADWLLNGLVKGARDIISSVVESNVKTQIVQQIEEGLCNVNSYLAENPELLLRLLKISIDDLEEHVVYL